ncbi:MAG: hypothetical protein C4329_14630 [Chitinophagaceae bacterium]
MQSKQVEGHRPRPDVRDDLDSRSNEEQETKGNDITHNNKDTRNKKQQKQKYPLKTERLFYT